MGDTRPSGLARAGRIIGGALAGILIGAVCYGLYFRDGQLHRTPRDRAHLVGAHRRRITAASGS